MIELTIKEIDNGFLIETDLGWDVGGVDKTLYSKTLDEAINTAIVELGILKGDEPTSDNQDSLFA